MHLSMYILLQSLHDYIAALQMHQLPSGHAFAELY